MNQQWPWTDLAAFLRSQGVEAKFYTFEARTTTVAEAVKQLNTPRGKIVKTIVMMGDRGEPLIGIVSGDRRVSVRKLAETAAISALRLAGAEDVYRYTGFPVGGTRLSATKPSFGPMWTNGCWRSPPSSGAAGR